jgi:hypothetical protein
MAIKRTVKFIPIEHGSSITLGDLGIFGVSGRHKYLGFKPAPGRKRAGWLVVATNGKGDEPRRRR